MPLMERVFNTTLEKYELPIHGVYITFEPRDYTVVPEDYLRMIGNEYIECGLVVVRDGDDLKQKEIEGLTNYRGRLVNRIKHEQLAIDDARRRGETLQENLILKQAEEWLSQIDRKLDRVKPVQKFVSFDDVTLPEEVKKEVKVKVKRVAPSSFDEAKVEELAV